MAELAMRAPAPRLKLARLRDLALVPAIVAIAVVGQIVSPVFLTSANVLNVLQAIASE